MGNGLGTNAKAAFRIESDQGMVSGGYPTTETTADAEEVLLDGYDLVPLLSEGVEEEYGYEPDNTLLGVASVQALDNISIEGGGSLECLGMYDGLDALIACTLGYEVGRATASPDSVVGTALAVITGGAGQTASNWKDNGTPFTSTAVDVGKFIRVTNGSGEGQVRRISAFTSSSEVTITPNWDDPPASTETGELDTEFEHLYECSNRLSDELHNLVDASYPTGGVGGATDQVFRRGTLGFRKQSTTPWIWRSVMVNSMSLSASAKSGLTASFDLVPFNLDRASATNGANSDDNWAFSESPLFTPGENQRVLFNHLGGNGFIRIDAFANGAMTSADEYGISDISIQVNNNLKADDQDSVTTPYRVEPARGGHREVTGSFTMPRYAADTFFAWVKADTILQMHIYFAGSTISTVQRRLEIFICSMKLTSGSAPVGGPDVLTQTFDFQAITPASAPTFIAGAAPIPQNPTQILITPRSEIMIRTTNQMPFSMFRDQNKEY